MSFLFSPKSFTAPNLIASPVTPPAPPPVEDIVKEEKKKLRKGRERRGTLLTGPRGILTAPSVLKQKLGA